MKSGQILTAVCRVLVGILFIFSGFVKADDPLGFAYKLQEYFSVFGISGLDSAAVYLSMIFSTFELWLGFTLLLGIYRNFTAWMLLILIVFFSFLTFYSAWFDKVTDCGCFGDAIHLTPWQSFSKDIFLLLMILVIVVNRKYINPLFKYRTAKNIGTIALLGTIVLNIYAFAFLPPINFRPYRIGNDIELLMKLPPNAKKDSVSMIFIYEKDGNRKELTMSQLDEVDSTWTFVSRQDKVIQKGDHPLIHDFAIYDQSGTSVTNNFLSDQGYKLLIVQWDLEKSNTMFQPGVNRLVAALEADKKVKLWPVTSSSTAIIQIYSKANNVAYPFYQMDNTVLKTIIRSNPGLVLFKGNTILATWPSTWLPSKEKIYSYLK